MSIAWTTVALLVLLLPGFLLSVVSSIPERFTREKTKQSPLAQLTASVGGSFLIHLVMFQLVKWTCGGAPWPCIDLPTVFAVLQLEGADDVSLTVLGSRVGRFAGWTLLYVVTSSLLGILLGFVIGLLVAGEIKIQSRSLRFLSPHSWVFAMSDLQEVTGLQNRELKKGEHDYVSAYLLTRSGNNSQGRQLLYKGGVRHFGLNDDGSFSYIVLEGVCERGCLDATGDEVAVGGWTPISSSGQRVVTFVNGSDIANVVLGSTKFKVTRDSEPARKAAYHVFDEVLDEVLRDKESLQLLAAFISESVLGPAGRAATKDPPRN